MQTGCRTAHAGSRLKPPIIQEGTAWKSAFQPYWGKLAVRNDRGDRGNVGIIRSPIRASILPDRHLMDQHGLTRADLIPLLGTPSRVSEVLRGKKGLSMAMVQRLRARFRVPADLLLPPPKKPPPRRSTKRAAA